MDLIKRSDAGLKPNIAFYMNLTIKTGFRNFCAVRQKINIAKFLIECMKKI